MAKNRTGKKRIIIMVFFGLFCAVFLFSGYQLISNMIKNKTAADAYQELRTILQSSVSQAADAEVSVVFLEQTAPEKEQEKETLLLETSTESPKPLVSMDFSSLQEINPEIVGWIRGEGTNIDYPVMQTDNNSYYLKHLYNGEYSNSGSIFMDYRNRADFADRNTVLYGHHMRSGVLMFGGLKEYKKQAFYDIYPSLSLFTPDGDFLIELISGTVENGNDEFISFDFPDNDAFLRYIERQRSRSTFQNDIELHADDRIITLCTCSYERENARYVVIGRLVRLYEDPQRNT